SPGIRLAGGLADSWKQAPAPAPIAFTHDWMQRKLGRAIGADEVASILESLAFGVTRDGERFTVTVPSWRATKDISIKDDLVEEVGRIIGYSSITPVAPEVPARVPPQDPERGYHRRIRAALTANGYTEVYNYSFISVAQAERFGLPLASHLRVLNPIAAGQELMRSSLLPNVLKNIEHNRLSASEFRLFEIGREIHKVEGALPNEIPCCAVVLYKKEGDGRAGLNELKLVVDGLAPGVTITPAEARHYEHPHRAGTLHWRGAEIGRLFEFHPSFVELGRAQVAYLNLAALLANAPGVVKYVPPRRFPVSEFDITVPVGPRTLAAEVVARVDRSKVPNLLNVAYLYEYETEDAKTMTLRFTLGAADRTLESAEIHAAQEIVRRALQ
ncbi:MAG: phenylalanine--tRNA ligase subunit beta, partial [Acidobacteria bacterium]|nr:phenylalanine--tRNA ligase subunit beta [Acidobacteriota bacterium]